MQLRPPVNQRLGRLVLRDADLGLLIGRKRVSPLEQLVVDGLEEKNREGDNGREDEGCGGVELEGEGGGVLCLRPR